MASAQDGRVAPPAISDLHVCVSSSLSPDFLITAKRDCDAARFIHLLCPGRRSREAGQQTAAPRARHPPPAPRPKQTRQASTSGTALEKTHPARCRPTEKSRNPSRPPWPGHEQGETLCGSEILNSARSLSPIPSPRWVFGVVETSPFKF